jgi:hypothetical protein
MKRDEALQEFLWCAVMAICLLFFAFAAGVWYDENVLPKEEIPVHGLEEVQTAVIKPAEPVMAKMPIPAAETAPAVLDPMVEDTYLRDDIPLSYELQAALYGACLEFEIDYPLALAMIEQETRFTNVMGDGGKAYGYFQVWPKWHQDRMAELGVTDLMDPESNFRVALHYMRENLDKYGNLEDALTAYNSGKPGSSNYSRQVMERMKNYG